MESITEKVTDTETLQKATEMPEMEVFSDNSDDFKNEIITWK